MLAAIILHTFRRFKSSIVLGTLILNALVVVQNLAAAGTLSTLTTRHKVTESQENARILDFKLNYAQAGDLWGTIGDIKRAQGNLPAMTALLEGQFGRPQEAWSWFHVRTAQQWLPFWPGAIVHLGLDSEGLAYGLVQNPVVPELTAVGLLLGGVSLGVHGILPFLDLNLGFTIAAGFGREKRIDAVSTDLIDKLPLRTGAVKYYGFDFDLNRSFLWRSYTFTLSGQTHETIFETTTPTPQSGAGSIDTAMVKHRWQARARLNNSVDLPYFDKLSIGFEALAGPQPLPVPVLPRSWDYAHDMYAIPELGAMFGWGSCATALFPGEKSVDAYFGFYGGYIGVGIEAKLKKMTLSLGSWGIENSAAYHALGERLWTATVGIGF